MCYALQENTVYALGVKLVIEFGIFIVVIGAIGYLGIRRGARLQAFLNSFAAADPIYLSHALGLARYKVVQPGQRERWRRGVLVITHKRLALYDASAETGDSPLFHAQPDEIQGFWRPVKYQDGLNEIWIHTQIGVTWAILKLSLQKTEMQKLIRAMKAITTEEQIKAYRRRRPYIHREPAIAYPAKQTLQGEWELYDPVTLYLMPLALVILQEETVKQVLLLADMQQIAALRRMEGGEPAGLIRFALGEADYAFATNAYEAWAHDLAEAAKRTLEEPLQRKRKSKSDDDEEDE